MSKEAFKTLLNHIITNANRMLWKTKDENIAPASQVQHQEPGEITIRLLSIMPRTIVSTKEHNQIIRNVVASTNDAAELTVGNFQRQISSNSPQDLLHRLSTSKVFKGVPLVRECGISHAYRDEKY